MAVRTPLVAGQLPNSARGLVIFMLLRSVEYLEILPLLIIPRIRTHRSNVQFQASKFLFPTDSIDFNGAFDWQYKSFYRQRKVRYLHCDLIAKHEDDKQYRYRVVTHLLPLSSFRFTDFDNYHSESSFLYRKYLIDSCRSVVRFFVRFFMRELCDFQIRENNFEFAYRADNSSNFALSRS